jgi:hypothetical protein
MAIVDVTVHIDETIDHDRATKIADIVRAHKGVAAVSYHDDKPHLMIIKYNPDTVDLAEAASTRSRPGRARGTVRAVMNDRDLSADRTQRARAALVDRKEARLARLA